MRKRIKPKRKTCSCCKQVRVMQPTAVICLKCRPLIYRARVAIQRPAGNAVAKAVRHGILPRLNGSIACADCGKPANSYDHRDYDKPLEVSPVCISCNFLRGPAKQFIELGLTFRRFGKSTPKSTKIRPDIFGEMS